MYKTLLAGVSLLLFSSTALAARWGTGITTVEKAGAIRALPGSTARVTAPSRTVLFALTAGSRQRTKVSGVPSPTGKTTRFELNPGQYWDATRFKRFEVRATPVICPMGVRR